MRRLAAGVFALLAGSTIAILGVVLADRWVTHFPSLTDIVLQRLPLVDLTPAGGLALVLYVGVTFAWFLRRRAADLPYLLLLVGLFYAGRGVFLLLLPIGPPQGAPAFVYGSLFGFGRHAFFPSGHAGLMFLLARMTPGRAPRIAAYVATALFVLGMLLSRTHYVADALGAVLLAYAAFAWGERHARVPLQLRDPRFATAAGTHGD